MGRRKEVTPPDWDNKQEDAICPLCHRPMPEGSWNEHHLVPATFGGREKITLHLVCHDTLHRTFNEREMKRYYNTIGRMMEHDSIQAFVTWIKKKPNDYYSKTKETKDRKRNRR